MAKAFEHQKHWKVFSYSESIQVLETFPTEKHYKNQQCNQACRSLPFDQPEERTHTGDKLNENVLKRYTYSQNDGVHKQVKPFVCKLCEESFIDSSDLINHEKKPYWREKIHL